jgi:hypothetical protein
MTNSRGGPKSLPGKQRSSKNSTKYGIYVDGFMPNDDPSQHQDRVDRICSEWGVKDSVGRMMADRVVHYDMRSSRLQVAMDCMIRERLYSQQARVDFCKSLGIEEDCAPEIPQWYITPNRASIRDAVRVVMDMQELSYLECEAELSELQSWSDGMGYFVFPYIWEQVFGPKSDVDSELSFLDRLRSKFEADTDREVIEQFVMHCVDRWHFEIDWYLNARRYSVVAQGIRARAMFDVTTDSKYLKAETLFQRRTLDALRVMSSVKERLVLDGSQEPIRIKRSPPESI